MVQVLETSATTRRVPELFRVTICLMILKHRKWTPKWAIHSAITAILSFLDTGLCFRICSHQRRRASSCSLRLEKAFSSTTMYSSGPTNKAMRSHCENTNLLDKGQKPVHGNLPPPQGPVCVTNFHGNGILWAWLTFCFSESGSLCPSLSVHFHLVWFGWWAGCSGELLEARLPNPGVPEDHMYGCNCKQLPTHPRNSEQGHF